MSDQVLLSNDEMASLPCDAWHVHGNVAVHKRDDIAEFIEKLKEKLPQVELPIDIGWTGYPVLTCKPSECPQRGWCLDKAHRFTAMIDGSWMFQRYTAGGPIMYGTLGASANNIMESEIQAQFLSKL